MDKKDKPAAFKSAAPLPKLKPNVVDWSEFRKALQDKAAGGQAEYVEDDEQEGRRAPPDAGADGRRAPPVQADIDDISGTTSSADIITVVEADRSMCKRFSLKADGALHKDSVATARGAAHGRQIHTAEALADLLKEVTSHDRKVIVPGHFDGDDGVRSFNLVYEYELAGLLNTRIGDPALGGVHTINDKRYAARLKIGIAPCAWLLLDCDTPEGMPPKFAELGIAGRLALLEKILPGISSCERVECRSSSARVVKPGGEPGGATHAWARVDDPDKVETLRLHFRVQAARHGLDFLQPKHDRTTGEVIAHARLTLVDLAVWTRGRLVFCSKPGISKKMVAEGYTIADADVRIVNPGGGPLTISHIEDPTAAHVKAYRKKTGENLEISKRRGTYSVVERSALKPDTPIEVEGVVKPLRDWIADMKPGDKLRCEAPFRDSETEAAFIRIDEWGNPFLYDSGTNTTYRIGDDLAHPPIDAEQGTAASAAGGGAAVGGGAGGGQAGQAGAGKAGAGQPGALGVIVELPSNVEATARKALAALTDQGEVYRRGRALVVPDASVSLDTRRGKLQHAAIVVLAEASLLRFLDGAARFRKFNAKGKLVPAYPSARLCKVLLEYVGDQPTGLPTLNGIMRGPFLRRDNTVCTDPGYDAASGIFLHPGETVFPALPVLTPANARKMAEQALGRLLHPLRAYQFDTSARDAKGAWDLRNDISRAVAVSMFLTGVSVHATRTRPAYLSDAPVFGSGKTILAELPALMMFGVDPPLISLADMRGGEERDKQLDAALLRGAGCIVFDNARGDLAKFGKLVMLLTGATVGVRLFHTQTSIDIDNNFLITVSGNNAVTNDDMARRFLRARIDTRLERPDQVSYGFDPRDEVVRDRGQMIIDALTIICAYQVAGSPDVRGRPYGSFETWAGLVRDSLMWLGLPDIVGSNDAAQADDPKTAALRAVLDAWKAVGLEGEHTATELAARATWSDTDQLKKAFLTVAAVRGGSVNVSPQRLGIWLTGIVNRRINGLCIAKRELDGIQRYRLDQGK